MAGKVYASQILGGSDENGPEKIRLEGLVPTTLEKTYTSGVEVGTERNLEFDGVFFSCSPLAPAKTTRAV
jgi:riboflavin synthase alpha subunit